MNRRYLLYLAVSILALGGVLSAQPRKFSSDFDPDDRKPSKVLVQFRSTPSDLDVDDIRKRGGKLKNRFSAFRGASFELPSGLAKLLALDPRVAYITPDRPVSGAMENARPAIGATIAYQYNWTGRNIGVAVIDSGISVNADLRDNGASRVVYSESFVEGENSTADGYGHGTHVAGIIGGNGDNSDGSDAIHTFRGIAPGVRFINLRVLDREGRGTDSQVIEAIQRAIELKSAYNIRVINISLGRPVYESCDEDPLCQAVESAWKAGIVVVVSAGNGGRDNSRNTNGYATISSPGNSPYAITVGAMRDNGTPGRGDDQVATYSAKGPTPLDHYMKPDIVAPGNAIASVLNPSSTLAARYPGNVVPISYYKRSTWGSSNYFRLSGTSMAAPMVSGAAALLLQKDPTLSPDGVKARLMKTATKVFGGGSFYTDPWSGTSFNALQNALSIGAGYLDVWAALNNSDVVPAGKLALSPKLTFDTASSRVLLVNGLSVVWGVSTPWATSIVWGNSFYVSGQSIVWGESTLSYLNPAAFSIVWGNSVVWGSSVAYPEGLSVAGEN